MHRLPEDLAQLRPDRLEGFWMLNKPLAARPAAPAVDLLDGPNHFKVEFVHRSPPPGPVVIRFYPGGYFALQGLDIGPIIEIPPSLSRIRRERLKLL